jgi:hypothetical protein
MSDRSSTLATGRTKATASRFHSVMARARRDDLICPYRSKLASFLNRRPSRTALKEGDEHGSTVSALAA